MEFIKKHYEKVVLGLVILGLAASAALLPFIISGKKDRLREFREKLTNPKVKELDPLDMTVQDVAWKRAQDIYVLDLTTKHNTFNPVLWQKGAKNEPIKITGANQDGVGLLELTTNTHELYLTISYEGPTANGYFVKVEKQNALKPPERVPHDATVDASGDKNSAYVLKELKGTKENPTELLVQAKDFGEFTVGPGKPFKKVDGYAADLRYKGEPARTFTDQRVGSRLVFGPNNQYRYKIVAINPTGVIVSAESNNKNTSISFNPSH